MSEIKEEYISQAKKEFGRQLAALRKELGLSQEEFASRAKVHHTYISAIETGKTNLTFDVIMRIAFTQNLRPKDLFSTIEVPEDFK
ncbi:helix-turn-helix domain-containing protein [Halobacillus sp. Marseille-P3879]|uniref:helix-turn-helix domain-containing protein n=1 Tax=Halobacillus sp. Marseille-P3879 TaxID=2045014 RepID=UPI000C7BDFFF|nr:helix-turn-helix transcriptional regulator [Halobacillus sp. Marseille-P3879]